MVGGRWTWSCKKGDTVTVSFAHIGMMPCTFHCHNDIAVPTKNERDQGLRAHYQSPTNERYVCMHDALRVHSYEDPKVSLQRLKLVGDPLHFCACSKQA